MRQSTRTHTYTRTLNEKQKKNHKSVQKKTSDRNWRSPEKGGQGKRKRTERLPPERFPFFSIFQSADTSHNHCCIASERKRKEITEAKMCTAFPPGGHLALGLSKQANMSRRNEERKAGFKFVLRGCVCTRLVLTSM